MLQQGTVRPRPIPGKAQARPGVFPLSTFGTQQFQPLPKPLGQPPYHFDLETVLPGITDTATKLGKLVFHTVGDTGGIKNGSFQEAVAVQMKADLAGTVAANLPRFFYHLGDVVYFNGQVADYFAQFYEPYDHYGAPIIAIPGNHDGDPATPAQTSLDGWVRYFMAPVPRVDPISGDAPRVTLSLPNVYFTLNCPFVTLIGMYTNVPEGGSVDSIQQQWLTNEFATAPPDKALVLALHHPIYSFDDHHSGSAAMADVVQHAINDSRRVPNMVLAGHVHNYQRIEHPIVPGVPSPFIVAGAGGYPNLHGITVPNGQVDTTLGATLVFGDAFHHNYVTLSVDANNITGVMTPIASTGTAQHQKDAKTDTFSYTAKPLTLEKNVIISL